MPWLVRYTSPAASGTPQPVDLLDRYAVLVSALWDLGTGGVAEQSAMMVAGFDDLATAHAAAGLARQHDLVADIEPVDDRWVRHDEEVVALRVPTGIAHFPIVAGVAFGHGGHPTTQVCLDLMSRLLVDDGPDVLPEVTRRRVFDLGTGSGVLAIAAHHLGATHIMASDIDAAAIDAARFNAAANAVDVQLIAGDIDEVSARVDGVEAGFDLIVANVLLVTHEDVGKAAAALLAPGGVVVAAGFLVEQADRVVAAYRGGRPTLEVIDRVILHDWCGLAMADTSAAG